MLFTIRLQYLPVLLALDIAKGLYHSSVMLSGLHAYVETKTGFDNLAECLAYAKLPWQSVGSANYDPREGGTCTLFSDNAIYHNTLENPRLQNAAESTPWRGYCAGHFNNGNSCARRGNTCAP